MLPNVEATFVSYISLLPQIRNVYLLRPTLLFIVFSYLGYTYPRSSQKFCFQLPVQRSWLVDTILLIFSNAMLPSSRCHCRLAQAVFGHFLQRNFPDSFKLSVLQYVGCDNCHGYSFYLDNALGYFHPFQPAFKQRTY